MRNKYQFRSRADATAAYKRADRERLIAEWLFTGKLNGTLHETKRMMVDGKMKVYGYLTLRHSAIVFSYSLSKEIHCGLNAWDSDDEQLANVIAGLMRYDETHEEGRQYDRARSEAYRAILGGCGMMHGKATHKAIIVSSGRTIDVERCGRLLIVWRYCRGGAGVSTLRYDRRFVLLPRC